MNLTGARALVTGAGGFIGSHVVELLVRRGAAVTAFMHYRGTPTTGAMAYLEPSVLAAVRLVQGDIRDAEAVDEAVAGQDAVLHLAASISVPYSFVRPRDVLDTNTVGTYNVLAAARRCRPGRVVVVSSSEVYGTAQYVPIDEGHPLVGQSPYAASKIAAEKLAESFHRAFGVAAVVARPFNAYGPRQTTRAVIPVVLAQAIAGRPVRLGSLSPRRDFTYVTDTAAGLVAAAEADAAVGSVFNLGSGQDISIGELVDLVGEVLGRPVAIEHEAERERPPASEVMQLKADASRARAILGWRATVPLREGLRRTAEWLAHHPPERRGGEAP